MSHQYDWWETETEEQEARIKSALSKQVKQSQLPSEAWVTIASLSNQSLLGLGFLYGMLSERLRDNDAEVAMSGSYTIEVGGELLKLDRSISIASYDDVRLTKSLKIKVYLKRFDWVPDSIWSACLTGKYVLPIVRGNGHERTADGTRLRVKFGHRDPSKYIEHTGLI